MCSEVVGLVYEYGELASIHFRKMKSCKRNMTCIAIVESDPARGKKTIIYNITIVLNRKQAYLIER